MEIKVYVVGYQKGYARWIDNCVLVDDIHKADVVFFTGGADVDPSTYHCKAHHSVWSSLARDREELAAWREMSPNQVAWGTCRGFQLLNCLFGGILVQDCDNHWCGGTHNITNKEGDIVATTSLHHQMIYPYTIDPSNYEILYWADQNRCTYYEGDKIDPSKILIEPEVAVWHREDLPTSLGVQGHPEMMSNNSELVYILNNLLKSYLK